MLFKKKEKVKSKININAVKKSALLVVGAFISAVSFNLFYVPYNFVSGGLGGIAIILDKIMKIDYTTVILLGNLIFCIISVLTIGFKKSLMGILGASIYTAFVYFTADFPEMIHFSFDNVLLYVLAAGICVGFGEGLVYKAGFNTGGTSILAVVIEHITKKPLGQILRFISYVIIAAGGFTMGYTSIMYSLIIVYISTQLIDKIIIGINDSKIFFITTSKIDEVTEYILNEIKSGVTELDTKGAIVHKKKRMIMCVVPSEKYSILKNAIKEIDDDAFIVVSDCYEVLGGTIKKTLSLEEE